MPNKYAAAHEHLAGPGDARPTALQTINDENLTSSLPQITILLTGASSGIGIETARALASTGATLFLTARNLPKARAACASFLAPGRVELLEMDNTSLASVRKAAAEFRQRSGGKLHLLVNNAGVMAVPTRELTEDGFEMQFGTNHLAHFLLFNLLKDIMLKSASETTASATGRACRVVNVSSVGHLAGQIRVDDYSFSEPNSYDPWKSYGQSKTANIYMTNEIERRFGAQGVHGIALHPGGIWTGLQKHVDEARRKVWDGVPHIFKSLEQGAATTVLAAVGKEFEGRGGLYLEDCGEAKATAGGSSGFGKHAFDEALEGRLWTDSLKMVGLEE